MASLHRALSVASITPRFTRRVEAAVRAFRNPHLTEEMRKAAIVIATDWGSDGAQANIEHQIKVIGQAHNTDLEVTTVNGIPPLGSSLIAAIEFDRIIDTHTITLELCVHQLEKKGLNKKEIEKQLPSLLLVNVFDREVGSDRLPAIVEGTIRIKGAKSDYQVSVSLIGPINNGIIGALVNRLESVRGFDLSNSDYHVSKLDCSTWDGRTIFSPIAALRASGVPASEFGNPLVVGEYPRIVFQPTRETDGLHVPLVDIDKIGNLVLGLSNGGTAELLSTGLISFTVLGDPDNVRMAFAGDKYSDVRGNEIVAYPGSNRLLELAVNGGSLATRLGLSKEGEHLELVKHGQYLIPATVLVLKSMPSAVAATA